MHDMKKKEEEEEEGRRELNCPDKINKKRGSPSGSRW
jgi:hypothetical protein